MSTVYTGNSQNVTSPLSATVTGATNASPIVITTAANHLFATGDFVTVSGVVGNTAANTTRMITVLSTTTFSLTGTTGNGAYVSGGTALDQNLTPQFTIPSDGDAFNVSSVNVALQTLADRTQYLSLLAAARTDVLKSGVVWTCPPGVTHVLLDAWGGGGGGGGGSGGGTTASVGSLGGAGGSRAKRSTRTVTVVPGTAYTVTIGAGGTAGTGATSGTGAGNIGTSGGDGGTTSFTDGVLVFQNFYGGSGGVAAQGSVSQLGYTPCGNSVAGVGYPTVTTARPPGGGWGAAGGFGVTSGNVGESDAFLGGGGGNQGASSGTAFGGGGPGGGQGGPGGPGGGANTGGNGNNAGAGGGGSAGNAPQNNSGAGGGGGAGGGFGTTTGGVGGAGGAGGSGQMSISYNGPQANYG